MTKKLLLLFFLQALIYEAKSQNLPLNFSSFGDFLRREQVIGNDSSELSFNYRPIKIGLKNNLQSSDGVLDQIFRSNSKQFGKDKKGEFSILPAFIDSRYNSTRPFGGNDGAMIPAKGVQTLVSAGVYAKYGSLSIQLYPQFLFVQNSPFEEYPEDALPSYFTLRASDVVGIDQPVRHGDKAITELLPGNSNVMMNFGSFQAGLSTENIWWGPGKSNALLLSNNAPGFLHAGIRTVKPAKTFIGNFEGQYFAGKLDGSEFSYYSDGKSQNLYGEKDNDTWRYFTGISISYAPKWIKGLSIGASRTFQVYRKDMEDGLRASFPLFDPFPKEGVGNVENILLREDQHLGVFFRWYIPKIGFEFYAEYMRNDHALNWRDAIMNPEHSRGYILGLAKYIALPASKYTLGIEAEMTQTQNSINRLTRYGGLDRSVNLYYNGQASHGLTNRGQILGSSLGLSGNQQFFKVSLVDKLNRAYVSLSRIEKDPHFYYLASASAENHKKWTDFIFTTGFDYIFKSFYFAPNLNLVNSKNVNWYSAIDENKNEFPKDENSFNLSLNIKVMYSF